MVAPIIIMAGGTGGHVFPALAVADALRGRGEEIVWLGTRHGLEATLVPRAGIPIEWIRVSGLRGKGVWTWILAPFRLFIAEFDALRVLMRRRPKLVLGMGGFASGPGGLAAWLLGRPLVIHEQNSVAGLTNKLLARIAREVLTAFPGAFSGSVNARVVGNPVRESICELPEPASRMAGRGPRLRVLVLGGSQGALILNQTVPAALALLADHERPEVRHQSGSTTFEAAVTAYREHAVDASVEKFIDDIAAAYGWADLVICRSGALTVSELAAAGLGSILVPFPQAVDDHQTKNAGHLVQAGAAVMIAQTDLTPATLAAAIGECIADRAVVRNRAEQARKLALPGATADVVKTCMEASLA